MSTQDELISFSTAKLAKEKGFKERCMWWYYGHSGNCTHNGLKFTADHNSEDSKTQMYSAPTQSLLQKWLRNEHNLVITALLANVKHDKKFYYRIDTYTGEYREQLVYTNIRYDTYELALEAGLVETLKLIKDG